VAPNHIPVLYDTVLEFIAPRENGKYIDCTLGAGGHSEGILERGGRVLGLDADPNALLLAQTHLARFAPCAIFIHSNFQHLARVAREHKFFPADGILLDLGISSMELADENRGFSFQSAGALDMRFDPTLGETASDLVNHSSEQELANIIFQFGEERASRRIARAIVNARPITTAAQLAQTIERAVGRHGRIHPATRTFQALRIAVNRELENVESVLPQIVETLAPKGRVVIIAYHSLEDRRVKNFFRESPDLNILTKHPIQPTDEELEQNPRSRSAKLRAAEKK